MPTPPAANDKGDACRGNPGTRNRVSLSNGAECHRAVDIPPAPTAQPLSFSRSYNSQDVSVVDRLYMGPGWRYSFSRRLQFDHGQVHEEPTSAQQLSSRHATPAAACDEGWSEISAAYGYPQAVARYDGSRCRIELAGRPLMNMTVYNSLYLPSNAAKTRIRAIRDDGHVLHFEDFEAEPGIRERLSSGQDGYLLEDGQGNVELYDEYGKLKQITDRSGNFLKLYYNRLGTGEVLEDDKPSHITDSFGRRIEFTYAAFNGSARLHRVKGPDNRQTEYDYDTNGRLISARAPDGRYRRYAYADTDWPNGLSSASDENGAVTHTWDYDSQGRVVAEQRAGGVEATTLSYNPDGTSSSTDAFGVVRHFGFEQIGHHRRTTSVAGAPCDGCGYVAATSYDAAGHVASRTDNKGIVTTYIHDAARGLELSRTEAVGTSEARTITTAYHPDYPFPVQIDEPGRRHTFTYEAPGKLTSRTVQDLLTGQSRSWTYVYGGSQLLSIDGPRTDVSDITAYIYNACVTGGGCGQVSTITNALGHVTTINSYDANGRPKQITDPNGLVTSLSYDMRGRLVILATGTRSTRFDYHPTGLLSKITLPDGNHISYLYDDAHRLIEIVEVTGNRLVYTLDAQGNRTSEKLYRFGGILLQSRSRTFDALGRLQQALSATGDITGYDYDANGNLTVLTDPLLRSQSWQHNGLDRTILAVDAASGLTAYAWDERDQLTGVTDPRQLHTAYVRNALGDTAQTQSPDSGLQTALHDEAGNRISSTDAKGQTTTYVYDALDRLTTVTYHDGRSVHYRYDEGTYGIGRLTSMEDSSGTTLWRYNQYGDLLSQEQRVGNGPPRVTGYAYATNGQRSQMTLPSGRVVSYTYSWGLGGPTNIRLDGVKLATGIAYRPFGGTISGWTLGNNRQMSRTFDLDGRITTDLLGSYGYDAASRLVGLTRDGTTQAYDYDTLDRLTGYTGSGVSITYAYDANGNRLEQGGSLGTSGYDIDPASNRVDHVDSTPLLHDLNGSLIDDGRFIYGYDTSGRMVSADLKPGATPPSAYTYGRYQYNGLNQRVQKTAGAEGVSDSTEFVYDESGHLIGEYGPSSSTETVWVGDMPIAVIHNGVTYYVLPDHLNTPRKIENQAKQTVWTWGAITFGGNLPEAIGGFNYNLRFPGQYYDAETGLHQNHHREYSAALGRYTQVDPLGLFGGSLSPFLYANQNPLSFIDPTGEFFFVPIFGWSVLTAGADLAVAGAATWWWNQPGRQGMANGSGSGSGDGAQSSPFPVGSTPASPDPDDEDGNQCKDGIASPRSLVSTQERHEMTNSQVRRMAEEMRRDGYKNFDPVDVQYVNGRLHIIDGHHRAAAARQAGVSQVPVRIWGGPP